MEIRLHGRGGQGGVTCAKLLAAFYARQGKRVQTFGDYAGERSGAPVRAYTRVSDGPIQNRNKVYRPDHLIVLDPHLLGDQVLAGFQPGGTLLLNSPRPIEELAGLVPTARLAVVDATAIARRHGIGTRTVVIVNTTIAGAWARVQDFPFEVVERTFRELGFLSNLPAAKDAYEQVVVREPLEAADPEPESVDFDQRPVEPLVEHRLSPPIGIPTGTWSTQRPHYVQNLAPCNAWCPAGNDVVGFIQAVARGEEANAAAILGTTTPFAGVCGRVCPAPCMEGYNRAEYDGAVNIRGLERWVADHTPVAASEREEAADPKRIAIVGGGPAGLSAAYELARAGHRATVFEGERRLGGVLHSGIPTYRLPREVLEREVEGILALGVEARCGERVDRERLAALAAEYDGVLIATGLQRLRTLDVPGGGLDGVEQGIHFLARVNAAGGAGAAPPALGGHVVVLGGGNTAMDCARSALRCGAERVTVVYRRTRAEMPAIREEVEEGLHEGVEFLFQRQPLAFEGAGRVRAVVLAEVEMGEPDEDGRRRPMVTDRTGKLECDRVLLALGQSADLSLLPDGWELRDGRIHAEDVPLAVFAAGDVATGEGTVTHAIGSGRRAAGRLLEALGVAEADVFERPDRERAVPATDIRFDHFDRRPPALDVLEPPRSRRRTFAEANHGLPDGYEAHRCFSCGHCTECDTCLVYCPEGIVRRREVGYDIDYTYCKGCGICVEECPRRALEMTTL